MKSGGFMFGKTIGRCAFAVAVLLAVGGCSVSTSTEAAPSSSAPTIASPSSATPTVPSLEPSSATQDFGPCVADSGIGTLVGDAGDLFEETQDALASGDIELFAAAAPKQAIKYDEVGRQIKALGDCGDPKYGQLITELGEVLIDIGSKLGVVTEQSLNASDGSGVAQIQEIGQLVNGAGSQMQIIGEYIVEATGQ